MSVRERGFHHNAAAPLVDARRKEISRESIFGRALLPSVMR